MRGRVLLVALLSAAPGHPLPSSPPRAMPSRPLESSSTSLAASGLAPSPYVAELAPSPFSNPASPPQSAARSARPGGAPGHVALLAPSPYELELVPNPYAGLSPARATLTDVSAAVVVGVNLKPRVLAPSPYEHQLASALAPSPY
jgi:hypothetical protein